LKDNRHDPPLTKRELALAATPLVAAPIGRQTRNEDFVPQFLTAAIYRGIAFGICFAAFVLLTDTFGIFTLVTKQAAPVTFMVIFAFVCSVKFVALSIATAVGLVAYSKLANDSIPPSQ
jgi:hypothetical protein